jgi:hypothetical protein
MFRLGAIATGGRMFPSHNLSFANNTLVGCMSGSWKPERSGYFQCSPVLLGWGYQFGLSPL